jgi:PAS domain S-box-containing protein
MLGKGVVESNTRVISEGDGRSPVSLLAEFLEHTRAEILLRVAAPAALDDLLATLRSGALLAGAPLADAAGADALHDCVFAVVEERSAPVAPRELRLVSAWRQHAVAAAALAREAHLREENRRFKMLLESLEDGVTLGEPWGDGHFLYLNPRAKTMLQAITGMPADEIAKRGIDSIPLPPQLHQEILGQRPRLLAGEAVTTDVMVKLPGGDARWRENRLTPVLNEDGSVAAVAMISRDITARKLAVSRLKLLSKMSTLAGTLEHEGVLAAVARLSIPELSDMCILDVVENGQVRRAYVAHRDPEKDKVAQPLMRISPAPLYATPGGREILAGKSHLISEFDASHMSKWNDELRCTYLALEPRSVMVVPFVVMGKTVAVAVFFTTAHSERRFGADDLQIAEELARRAAHIIENARLHEELRQRDASLRTALAHSNIGVFQQDRELAFKWTYNEIPPETMAPLAGDKQRALAGERTRSELPVVLRGEPRDLVVIHEPVTDAAGVIVGLVGTTVDVTVEKRVQKELEQTLAFRDQMMAILGHDLRNPLGAVLGIVGLARLDDRLAETTRAHLGQIEVAARRMLELIGTLLDFTQTRTSGRLPITTASTDLGELAARVVDELAAAHLGSQIELESAGDTRGEWDPGRLGQVVSNLVGNAIAHGDSRAPVRIALDGDEREVVLTVHNRGPAIASELLPVLFEPFRRGPQEPRNGKSQPRGLGLGLYIAREIVSAHGGTIAVRSSAHEGTTFVVRLPRRRR